MLCQKFDKRTTAPRRTGSSLRKALIAMMTAAAAVLGFSGVPAHAEDLQQSARSVTNLTHLTSLLSPVPLLPGVPEHTTYNIDSEPLALAPWVYANNLGNGHFENVGGGDLIDPVKNWYAQGAFDSDDIARAAIVFVRDWRQSGSATSKKSAYELMRELTYLQNSGGSNAGNVVLWQQVDGTLNLTPTPPDSPNPSDSGNSYWLARTIWALGEAYSAFESTDPGFAAFLSARMDLAVSALNRETLSHYGQFVTVNGAQVPAWLITNSAGATAEAVLGLASFVAAQPTNDAARTATTQLASGLALMASGGPGQWPFGAILPEGNSRTFWHAWSGLAPAALIRAGQVLHHTDWQNTAEVALAQFSAQLLVSGGPYNGLEPTPVDRTQIAYGVDSLVQSFLEAGDATRNTGFYALAAITSAWYFGANPAHQPTYNPATGSCVDGISSSGDINSNCGAESSIHTDLSMLALNAHPAVRDLARTLTEQTSVHGMTTVAAASATLSGPATVETPVTQWMGSGAFFDNSYVDAHTGATLSIPVPEGLGPSYAYAVTNAQPGDLGVTTWSSCCSTNGTDPTALGSTENGGVGDQGVAPSAAMLAPLRIPGVLPAGSNTLYGTVAGAHAQINAVIFQPVVGSLTLSTGSGTLTLYANSSAEPQQVSVAPHAGPVSVSEYSATGSLLSTANTEDSTVHLAPSGFTTVNTTGLVEGWLPTTGTTPETDVSTTATALLADTGSVFPWLALGFSLLGLTAGIVLVARVRYRTKSASREVAHARLAKNSCESRE